MAGTAPALASYMADREDSSPGRTGRPAPAGGHLTGSGANRGAAPLGLQAGVSSPRGRSSSKQRRKQGKTAAADAGKGTKDIIVTGAEETAPAAPSTTCCRSGAHRSSCCLLGR